MMLKSRRFYLTFLAIGLAIATVVVGRNPSHAINLKRTIDAENDFIVQQLQLLKSKNTIAFDRLEDIEVLREALGLPEKKDPLASNGNLPASVYEYQYQIAAGVNIPTIEVNEVLVNIGNTLSRLNFSRTNNSAAYQVQILAQSSLETVDEGIYYFQGNGNRTEVERGNVISTILAAPQIQAIKVAPIQAQTAPKVDNVTERILGGGLGGTLSFLSGVREIKQGGLSLSSKSVIPFGDIKTIPANVNYTNINIQKSEYQLAAEEQNQQYLEEQAERREELQKQLEKAKEKREKEKEKIEEKRQDSLEDAKKQREDRLEDLQKNRQKLVQNFLGR